MDSQQLEALRDVTPLLRECFSADALRQLADKGLLPAAERLAAIIGSRSGRPWFAPDREADGTMGAELDGYFTAAQLRAIADALDEKP